MRNLPQHLFAAAMVLLLGACAERVAYQPPPPPGPPPLQPYSPPMVAETPVQPVRHATYHRRYRRHHYVRRCQCLPVAAANPVSTYPPPSNPVAPMPTSGAATGAAALPTR